jgi:hypothetical protein
MGLRVPELVANYAQIVPFRRRTFEEIRKLDEIPELKHRAWDFSLFTKFMEKVRYIERMENVWKRSERPPEGSAK